MVRYGAAVAQRDPRTHLGAFVGRRLQRARLKAGFSSQEALADELHMEKTVVAKVESGERAPTPAMLAAWCELTKIAEPDLYTDLYELARTLNGAIPEWFKEWLEAEAQATSLRIWQPWLVPGLFHTARYAEEIIRVFDPGNVEALVATRLERAKILDRDDPPDVVAVVGEYALRNLIGSAEIMAEQLAHLAEMSRRPNVVVQVLPEGIGAHAGLGGAFDIASGDGTRDLLRIESVAQDITTETSSIVRRTAAAFDLVRAEALTRGQSRDLILKLGDELWTPKE